MPSLFSGTQLRKRRYDYRSGMGNFVFCKDTSLKEEGTEQVQDFKEVDRKDRKGRCRQVKEWLQRDWKNPRNVFSPEAPVTHSGSEPWQFVRVA